MITEGKISLECYLAGIASVMLKVITCVYPPLDSWFWLLTALYILTTYLLLLRKYNTAHFQVAVRALGLGFVFSLGLILSVSDSSFRLFGWYTTALAFFHWSEYFATALSNPKNLTLDSYLLDHSQEYRIAALCSLLEFSVELFFFDTFKQPSWFSCIGLCIVIGGDGLRKLSMITASKNFNHYVQFVKSDDHDLVQHGVYGLFRHPAYVGWFYWSIGTQIMLCNPVCLVGYTIVSWKFFNSRIYDEEAALISFFNEEYVEYQKKVPTGIPFVKGFKF